MLILNLSLIVFLAFGIACSFAFSLKMVCVLMRFVSIFTGSAYSVNPLLQPVPAPNHDFHLGVVRLCRSGPFGLLGT